VGASPRIVRPSLAFEPLRAGLADFVTVSEAEIAEAIRILLEPTHNLAEGAGPAGLAGLRKLAGRLAGKRSRSSSRVRTSTKRP
jgi:threonine dehydratase